MTPRQPAPHEQGANSGRMCCFFSSRRRHTRCSRDWSSDVCSSDLHLLESELLRAALRHRADRTRPRQRPLGTPRSRETRVAPQEWPPTTACELSPKPRSEPTYRPPPGPEPRKILSRTPPHPP